MSAWKTSEGFPSWAVCYAMYGDSSGISDEERREIDAWMEDFGVSDLVDYDPTGFSSHPDFGLACDVGVATFAKKKRLTRKRKTKR